jgi:hypothetical protein
MVVKKPAILAVAACTCLLGGAGTLDGGPALSLQVSPAVGRAPAFVSVRTSVEASDDNRSLEIVAQSSEFYRSSRIDLDGRNAPRLAVFEYPSLPAGSYEMTAILAGTGGKQITVSKIVKIVPTFGSGH